MDAQLKQRAIELQDDIDEGFFDYNEVFFSPDGEAYFGVYYDGEDIHYFDIKIFPFTGTMGTTNFDIDPDETLQFDIQCDKTLEWHLKKLYKMCEEKVNKFYEKK